MLTNDEIATELEIFAEEYWDDDGYGNSTEQYDRGKEALDSAAYAFRHGALYCSYWIDINNKNGALIDVRCKRCGNSPENAIKSDFCPNCGAKMYPLDKVEKHKNEYGEEFYIFKD